MITLKENLLRNIGVGKIRLIEQWIEKNLGLRPSQWRINKDFTITVNGSVIIEDEEMTELPEYIQFSKVKYDFKLYCPNLVSLRGCPKKVGRDFTCSDTKISTLDGCPEEVSDFRCAICKNLKSLKGCPLVVDNFDCYGCTGLTDLTGSPREVKMNFDCSECRNLVSLTGCPKRIGGVLSCDYCLELRSFEGVQPEFYDSIYCTQCLKLTLNGFPRIVQRNVYCEGTPFGEKDIRKICDVKGDVFGGK